MQLDVKVCRKAMLSKDARFDGRFFVGVRSTGIYCRPICPAPTPKAENVDYYTTASAAAEAGFRPCLRCRPEAAPGSDPWRGTAATVSRALRLIGSGELEEPRISEISARLGISSRQLGRLFHQHLGAPPKTVARTHRLQFAKKLLDETDLSVADVAFSAGFGSVRRFNAIMQETYGRTPTQVRRLAREGRRKTSNDETVLSLQFRPPYDWSALLDFFLARSVPGVESVDNGRYRRTIDFDDTHGWIEVSGSHDKDALQLRVVFPSPRSLLGIVERTRRLFDLDADSTQIERVLVADDLLRRSVLERPGLRVPGAWDGFELATRAVLGQQVSVKAARTLAGRLASTWGEQIETAPSPELTHLFPKPESLAEADVASIGLTKTRATTLRRLARVVADGELDLGPSADLLEARERLLALPGIGPWTAEYIAMRALGDPDAFPAGDLGLRKAIRPGEVVSEAELERLSTAWRPWRAYAVLRLWNL